MVAPEGKVADVSKMDKAEVHNSDGYGVSWYEEGQINTYRTMHYTRLKEQVALLDKFPTVVHLRNTTCGGTNITNTHPFDVPSGVLFHNGTIHSLAGYKHQGVGSDTSRLADLISECDYKYIEDIEPLLHHIIGDDINRLVFLEDNGRITIMKEKQGYWEDGIWYSNDYHKKPHWWSRKVTTKPKEQVATALVYDKDTGAFVDPNNKPTVTTQRVFVYGTLKRGHGNHRLLDTKGATYLGKAQTVGDWTMVGKGMPFPYLLKYDKDLGGKIQGEVYEVDASVNADLDNLEGVPTHYRRLKMSVEYLDTKDKELVTTYVKSNQTQTYNSNEYITEWGA